MTFTLSPTSHVPQRSSAAHVGRRPSLRHAVVLVALLIPVVPMAAHAQPSKSRSSSYDERGYRGRVEALADDWRGGGNWDRRVRSVRVPAGVPLTLYSEPNFEEWRRG